MNERYIATADLGSSKIALSIAKVDGKDVQVLYYKESVSDGIRYSTVFNPTRAAEPLKQALSQAEEELGIKVSSLIIGLPRYSVRQETHSGEVDRNDSQSCITAGEVEALKEEALESFPLSDEAREEMFGAVAQSFSADDLIQGSEEDVIGIPSGKLTGIFKVFIGSKRSVSNIDILMKNAGVESAYKFFLPDITAKAVLTQQELDNGVALVEMGAGVTSLAIYHGAIMRYFSSIPFGAKNITLDIKHECGFSESLAENIKLAFGACIPEKLLSMGEKIIQINDDESGSSEQLPVKYLSEIITGRAKEIIEAILFEIQQSGYADRLRSGIVLTGGGANLANITNLIKDLSGYTVRLGFPRCKNLSCEGISGLTETSAAATVGMIIAGRDRTDINCTEGGAVAGKKKKEEEETADPKDTVFGNPGRNGAQPVPKPSPRTGKGIKWGGSLSSKTKNIFGNLFDEMS